MIQWLHYRERHKFQLFDFHNRARTLTMDKYVTHEIFRLLEI